MKLESNMERMISPEKIMEALSLLVDCYFNNSLIVSKYLITDVKVLHRFIILLSNADSNKVEIGYEAFLATYRCTKGDDKRYVHITKIYGDGIDFKIKCLEAAKLFEEHRPSTKHVLSC
jgi:hypothetical protein